MYKMNSNNFYQKPKKSTIYTTQFVSNYIYDILHKIIPQSYIFDLCVGKGFIVLKRIGIIE
ncbi:hypothetical protein [Candidatus Phytoplasma sp. AldY-WA1]|uniref:hypothetical protein n=1 Tax=Candidatus Phytoplasma sp. AldY-WA1 TaxID=2852100 RepID=UPI00254D7F64|nr:hypothetical protein [Candidatus Phytoplasma sp. AldY-WA1]